ncbi:hypothetical protein LCGC14_0839260 [marine sediment metagenome]|uniref:Uncharacterized protein n=1 Tax=marine sediment metagenome TaxID=412755 RepID=A0A0F9PYX1_9ZZZZ
MWKKLKNLGFWSVIIGTPLAFVGFLAFAVVAGPLDNPLNNPVDLNSVAQDICVDDAAGPCLQNEAASTTNPTLIPNQVDRTTGIGWSSGAVRIINSGTSRASFGSVPEINSWDFGSSRFTADGTFATPTAALESISATATVPGFVFANDPDTGLGTAGTNQLSLIAGGIEGIRIDATNGTHTYLLAQDGVHLLPREVFSIFDDFTQQTLTEADGPWIENSGTDPEAVDAVIEATAERGVVTIVSGDASGSFAADGSQIVAHIPVQADSGGLVFETRLHIDTAVTTVSVCAGFTDITTLQEPASISGVTITTTAVNAVVFCYDTAADTDEWYAIGVDTNTDATGNAITGTAPTADIFQVLRIEVDADGETARLYIDGTLEVSLTAAATAASANLFATVTVNATTTTSRAVDIDYIYVGHTR